MVDIRQYITEEIVFMQLKISLIIIKLMIHKKSAPTIRGRSIMLLSFNLSCIQISNKNHPPHTV